MEWLKNLMNYNCLYEAGLFTGALGIDKNRVFLVTNEAKLPSDLSGIFRFKFRHGNADDLQTIAELIAQKIFAYEEDEIHPLRGLRRPVLTKEELLQRETVIANGGMLTGGALVFVNTTTPIEAERPDDDYMKRFIDRVVRNILENDISYFCMFERKESNTTTIAK